MSSVIKKVKEVGSVVKDVITGRPKHHSLDGVIGHNIRPFPRDIINDPRRPGGGAPQYEQPPLPRPRFTNLIGSGLGEATSEIPNRPTR